MPPLIMTRTVFGLAANTCSKKERRTNPRYERVRETYETAPGSSSIQRLQKGATTVLSRCVGRRGYRLEQILLRARQPKSVPARAARAAVVALILSAPLACTVVCAEADHHNGNVRGLRKRTAASAFLVLLPSLPWQKLVVSKATERNGAASHTFAAATAAGIMLLSVLLTSIEWPGSYVKSMPIFFAACEIPT